MIRAVRPEPTQPAGYAAWVLRSVLLGAVVLGTAGCQSTTFTRLGLPVPVTRQGEVVVTLWRGSWIAAFAVGAVVWGMILWAVIFHRKRSDRPPRQVRYNLPIEIMYTVVPFIMVGVFFFFTARDENYINKLPPQPGCHGQRDRVPVELGVPVSAVQDARCGAGHRHRHRRSPGRGGCRCWSSRRTRRSGSTWFR